MASSKIKGINIKIGADTKGLDTALKGIESAGKRATSELREVNSSLRNNSDSVVLWRQKQELLTTAVEESRKKLEFLRDAQEQIKRQFENGEIDDGQYRAFQREVENTERATQRLENQLQEANQRVDELGNGLEESGQQAEDSANGGYSVLGNVFANVITEGIKLAGTALKNFTADVVTTGMEYESAISNVTAISGAMAEEVEMLQAKAEEMGATTKFTAAESAEAMSYMAMAGWKVNDMVSGLDGIMDLSAASGESLASVSDIVTDALTAFGLQAGDSAHFADVLAAASSNANTNVSMMGETFKYAAPIAGALGFSVEDTAEAIGLMANSGIKASQAGTSLRTIMTNLSQGMTIYGKAFESAANAEGEYTIATTTADGSMRDLGDILADLRVAWGQLTEAEQASNAATEMVAGKHAMSGFLALMNAAPADVEKLSTAIENADGAAQGMASTMLDNLQGDKTLLDSAVDGMKIAVSKELNPALRDLVQYATSQIPKVQAVVEPLFKGAVNSVKLLINGFEKMKPVLSTLKPLIITIFANEAISLFATKILPKALELLGKLPSPLALITKPIEIIAKTPQMLTGLFDKIKTVPSLLSNVGNAFKGLWTVISAHPYAAVAVGALAAVTAAKSYIDNLEIEKTEVELLIEKHNEELQLLHDKRRAIEDLNDAFYENVGGIQNQTDRTKDLWNELDKLADQYGNVQQKDKTRAEYILNELNEALGTEYTMTRNQIDNYKLLSAEIDNVIQKKQAEMLLDSYLANSEDMTKQRIEAREDYEKYDAEYREKEKELEKAERLFEIYKKDFMNGSKISVEDYLAGNLSDTEISTKEGRTLANDIITAREELQQAKNARRVAKQTYEATSEYFENLDRLQEAYSLGQYDRMADILYCEQDLTDTTLDESATDAEQRLQIYSDSLLKTLSDFNLAVEDMSQKSVDELEKEFSNTMQAALQAGVDPAEVWANFSDGFKEMQKNGLDISSLITPLVDSGVTPADIFGNDWKTVFQTQLANGGDMTSIVEWLKNSDYNSSIPLVFGNNANFMKYLKEQSAQGLDVSSLLELGVKSGLRESEDFVNIFKSNVSKNLANGWDVGNLLELGCQWGIDLGDEFGESFGEQMITLDANGVDLITFVKWAESQGKSVADVFGENFQTELSEYLKNNFTENFENLSEKSGIFNFFYGNNSLTNRLTKVFADGKDISALARQAQKSGLKIGTVFGDDFMNVIQEQLNTGYDINELVKWAVESGETVSSEYSDVYTELVQGCIDEGYDIENLLQWGNNSGISTADAFGNRYTPEVQTFIDRGFSVDSLLNWAHNAGYNAGAVFGEQFQEIANSYIDNQREAVESFMNTDAFSNSPAFSILKNHLPFMADGGFLSNGQAVVAEAGPELLEVMNGGVKVTPLTGSARNTSVSDGVQNVYYSNYTINATISGDYDVRRLAEDLETEKQRYNNGRGVK